MCGDGLLSLRLDIGTRQQISENVVHSMFLDRKRHFIDHLGWKLSCTEYGEEIDEYDNRDTQYVILSDNGNHVGSLRINFPENGTLLEDIFFSNQRPDAEVRWFEISRLLGVGSHNEFVLKSLIHSCYLLAKSFGLDYGICTSRRSMVRLLKSSGCCCSVYSKAREPHGDLVNIEIPTGQTEIESFLASLCLADRLFMSNLISSLRDEDFIQHIEIHEPTFPREVQFSSEAQTDFLSAL